MNSQTLSEMNSKTIDGVDKSTGEIIRRVPLLELREEARAK